MKLLSFSKKSVCYLTLLAGLVILSASGCATSYAPAVTPDQMSSEPLNEQVLSAGDVIEIKFLYNPEMDDTQRVRPDGKITLKLIGEVTAKGKNPESLQQELTQLYASELKKPSVTVTAKSLRNNKVYVGGEVLKPGEVEIPGQLTALEAISQAGGFRTETAEKRSVIIIRSRSGKHYGTLVNFEDALKGKEIKPFYLRAGDILYVPQTTIAKANMWIEQHINKMLPRIPVSFAP
jgi:polysaccharide biosynthesis/export protein